METFVPTERIEQAILLLRGQRILLDSDLALLYGVPTKALNQAVRRNTSRFPADFMFRLSKVEWRELVTICDRFNRLRHSSAPPAAFTEQGVAMLSSVLRSDRAIAVNIEIMRAFVRLRGILAAHKDLALRLDELESRYDDQFKVVFEAIRQLMAPPPVTPKRRIGFQVREKRAAYRVRSGCGGPA